MTQGYYADYLRSPWWQAVRLWAIRRAKHRCQHPGCTVADGLEVHHLSYAHLGDERSYEVRVLCATHHQLAHGRTPAPREPSARQGADEPEHIGRILARVLTALHGGRAA